MPSAYELLYGTATPKITHTTTSTEKRAVDLLYGNVPVPLPGDSIAVKPAISTQEAPADAAAPPMESLLRQTKWRGKDLTDATFSLGAGMVEAAYTMPLVAVDAVNRSANSMYALMLGDPKWKEIAFPELIVEESGKTAVGKWAGSIANRFGGAFAKESPKAPIPHIFRPSGTSDYSFHEALTFQRDPVKRAAMVAAMEGGGKVGGAMGSVFGKVNGMFALDMLGGAYIAPDVPFFAAMAKVGRMAQAGKVAAEAAETALHAEKALEGLGKVEQAADAATAARNATLDTIEGRLRQGKLTERGAARLTKKAKATPTGLAAAINDAAPAIGEYGIDLLKQATRPDIMSARALTRYIAEGKMDAMVYHDPRIASMTEIGPALFEQSLRDPDKLLPSAALDYAKKIVDLRGKITLGLSSMSSPERQSYLKNIAAQRKVTKGIGAAHGKDVREVAALTAAIAQRTDAYSTIQHNMNLLSFFVDEPKDAIPQAYVIGTQARRLQTALTQRLMDYSERIFQGVSPESDEKIFNWLNAKRKRIVNKDSSGREIVTYEDSPERTAAWWDMSKEDQQIAASVDDFQEQAADKLNILDDERYIEGYAPRIFPAKDFENNLPPELIGFQTQGNVMFAHLLPRVGAEGYTRSAKLAMQTYIRGYAKKVTIQPAINLIRQQRLGGDKLTAMYTNLFINELGGKAAPVEKVLGPAFEQLSKKLGIYRPPAESTAIVATQFYYGMLINPGFVVKQLFQGLNSVSKEGPLTALKGLGWMASDPRGREIAKALDLGVEFSRLRESRIDIDALERMPKAYRLRIGGTSEKPYRVGDLLNSLAGFGDSMVRGFAFATGMSSYAKKAGKSIDEILRDPHAATEAIEHALRSTEATQFVYGVTGRNPLIPGIVGGDNARLLTMMQSFYVKQTRFVLNTAMEDWGFAWDWLLYTGMAARVASQQYGIDTSSFSGPGMLLPTMRWGQPPAMSPPVSTLWAAYGLITSQDPKEREMHKDNLIQLLGSQIIPGYLGLTKAWNGFKAIQLGAIQRKGATIQAVTRKDAPGLMLGLPLWTAAERRLTERRNRLEQQRDRMSAEMQWERLFEAFYAEDDATFDAVLEGMGDFGPRDPSARIKALVEAEMYPGVARLAGRDWELFLRSGGDQYMKKHPEQFAPVVIRDDKGKKVNAQREKK